MLYIYTKKISLKFTIDKFSCKGANIFDNKIGIKVSRIAFESYFSLVDNKSVTIALE